MARPQTSHRPASVGHCLGFRVWYFAIEYPSEAPSHTSDGKWADSVMREQLMAVVPLDDIWVTANFKETQLSRMKPGQRVRFTVDAYGRTYTGKIVNVGGASGSRFSVIPPENATGNYVKVVQRIPVRINLDPGQNSDHLLRPGMSVDPKVYLE